MLTSVNAQGHATFRRTLAWLGHPLTVCALILLVGNDHLLKRLYPGWLTGKLSDVAGLVLAPALLGVLGSVVVPRFPARALAVVALVGTGAAFAIVKSDQYASQLASRLWSVLNGPSIVAPDASDLCVLPALGLAWYAWRSAQDRSPPRLTMWLIPLALLGVAASAAPEYPDAVGVVKWRGHVLIGEGNAARGREPMPALAYVSDDGVNFTFPAEYEASLLYPPQPGFPTPRSMDCLAAECFRVVPGRLAIEASRDGGSSWHPAWGLSTSETARLARYYPELGDVATNLSCLSIVVQPVPFGYVVVAACGRDGFVERSALGEWRRIGFPPLQPAVNLSGLPALPLVDPGDAAWVLLAGWAVLATGLELLAAARRRAWGGVAFAVGVAAGLAASAAVGSMPREVLDLSGVPPGLGVVLAAGCAIPWGLLLAGRLPRRGVAAVAIAGAVCMACVATVFGLRTHLVITGRVAGWLAVGVAFLGVLAAVSLSLRGRNRPASRRAASPADDERR